MGKIGNMVRRKTDRKAKHKSKASCFVWRSVVTGLTFGVMLVKYNPGRFLSLPATLPAQADFTHLWATPNENAFPAAFHISSTKPLEKLDQVIGIRETIKPLESDFTNLRNINLVLMGDSITRYQYLSLVYFLRWGEWFNPKKRHPHLVKEDTFSSPFHKDQWLEFFFQTTLLLAPNEHCDCYRPIGKVRELLHQIHENRYYYDAERNISVSYIKAYGHWIGQHGLVDASHTTIPDLVSDSAPKNIPQSFQPFTWETTSWGDTIRHHIAHLKPKPQFVVLNAGHWGHFFGKNETLRSDLVSAFQETQITPVWKTTTATNRGKIPGYCVDSDKLMCEALQGCLDLTWTIDISQTMMWDRVHYWEPAYRRMNEQMLTMLQALTKKVASS